MTDAVQPQTLSLRVSVIDRCQQRCLYCMPPEGVSLVSHAEMLRLEEVAEFVRVAARRFALAKVHLTGGEPLLRRGLADLVRMLAGVLGEARPGGDGAGPAADLALTTNGRRLAAMAADLCRAGLRRVNVSLDTLDPGTYGRLTRGGVLAEVLDGIEAARATGLAPVKVNTVVLRGINDGEVGRLARFSAERGCEARFLELMPIGSAGARHGEWFVPASEVRSRLSAEFALSPLPRAAGASARRFALRDGRGLEGVVGFISPASEPFCGDCRRLRLTATGRLLGCLARARGVDVRPMLRAGPADEAALVAAVGEALLAKRAGRCFAEQQPMHTIGG